MSTMPLSPKYKAFLRTDAKAEFLEGTTAAGKTTVGAVKFMFKVAQNPKKLHILSGLDLGTIEKNIISKDLGILEVFAGFVEYNSNGKGDITLPHLLYKPKKGVEKVVLVLGYDNKKRWQKALGGQYGCLYIDEINIADMDYVREAVMRCDYLMATLNPDDPSLPVYKEYVNCSRPLPQYIDDTPRQILDELKEQSKPGWIHWFFSFKDNLGLPEEKKQQIINSVAPGTKQHKNKILGLRGRATGLVFPNFEYKRHAVPKHWLKNEIKEGRIKVKRYTAGLDTSYSSQSEDTISMVFQLITECRKVITVDEKVYSNKDISIPLAPSDTVNNFIDFLERNRQEWGFAKNVYIDSADQATITELNKHKRLHSSIYNFVPAYKKTKIIDRIKLMQSWLHKDRYLILSHCKNHISEMESYSWDDKKDNEPEDRNDHTINASQYAWLPYVMEIGDDEEQESEE